MLFRLTSTTCIVAILGIFLTPIMLQAEDRENQSIVEKIQDNLLDAGGEEGAGFPSQVPIELIIGNIIKALLLLTGSVFLALAVYGGLRWMNARGNPEEAKTARGIIIDATIGLVIVLGAWALTEYILFYALVATGLPPVSPS